MEHSALACSEEICKSGHNKSQLVHDSGFRHFCAEFLTGSLKSTTKFPLNIKAEKTVLFYSIATCMSYNIQVPLPAPIHQWFISSFSKPNSNFI
jgi:hypothetical protein